VDNGRSSGRCGMRRTTGSRVHQRSIGSCEGFSSGLDLTRSSATSPPPSGPARSTSTATSQGRSFRGSGFVSPKKLGAHQVWTHQQPGIDGIPNPRGRPVQFESFGDLALRFYGLTEAGAALVARDDPDPLRSHVERVGEAARYPNPAIRMKTTQWLASARNRDIPLSSEGLQQVADVAAITTLTSQINASWHVALSLNAEA
jgi:hypothetical protein